MSKDDGNYSLAKLARGVLESASDKATTNDVNTILKSYIPVNGLKEGCTRHDENFIVHLSSVNTSISFYLGSDVKLRCYGAGVGSTIELNNPDSHNILWNIIKDFYTYKQHPMNEVNNENQNSNQ